MEGFIKIPNGFIPMPTKYVAAPTTKKNIPSGATEGSTCRSQGGGKLYRNVYRDNRMTGYAVYANGCGFDPQGFLYYEPLPSPATPPQMVCADPYCKKEVGECDAELYFEGFSDAIAAQTPRCPECQYFHDTDETRFALSPAQ